MSVTPEIRNLPGVRMARSRVPLGRSRAIERATGNGQGGGEFGRLGGVQRQDQIATVDGQSEAGEPFARRIRGERAVEMFHIEGRGVVAAGKIVRGAQNPQAGLRRLSRIEEEALMIGAVLYVDRDLPVQTGDGRRERVGQLDDRHGETFVSMDLRRRK